MAINVLENGEKVTWTRARTAAAFDEVVAKLRAADELWEEIKANAPKEIADQIRWGNPTIDKAELMAFRVRADITTNHTKEDQE